VPVSEYAILPPPVKGLNQKDEAVVIDRLYTPDIKNMIVSTSRIYKRLGYTKLGANSLSGKGSALVQFDDGTGTKHLLAFTTLFVYEYVSSDDTWQVKSVSKLLHDCETGWNTGTAVSTPAPKVGSKCLKLTISTDVSDGDKLDYVNDTFGDLSSYSHLMFWVRSDKDVLADSIELVLCQDSDGAKTSTYVEFTNTTAMTADTWYRFEVSGTFTGLTAVSSIGLYCNHDTDLDGDSTPVNLYLDDIRVVKAFTGDDEDHWLTGIAHDSEASGSNDPYPWESATALVACNNTTDGLVSYDGAVGEYFAEMTLPSGVTAVKEVAQHYDHLFIYNFLDNSVQRTKNLRNADIGDTDNWTSGTSGEVFLTDSIGKILRALELKSDMIIYSDNSITTQRYVGGELLFAFRTYLTGVGLYATKAIWKSFLYHIFVGTDQKIYRYYGGSDIQAIGDLIELEFFERLNSTQSEKIVLGADPGRHKLYVFFPDRKGDYDDTYAQSYYAFDTTNETPVWEFGRFAHSVCSFSVLDNVTQYTCDGIYFAGHTCDEYPTLRCNDAYLQAGYPLAAFLSYDEVADESNVFTLNQVSGLDYDQDIACHFVTGDFTTLQGSQVQWFRVTELAFNACCADSISSNPSMLTVEYSADLGNTWIELADSPIVLNDDWTEHRLELDVVSRQIRFRFSQDSDGDFQWRSGMIKFTRRVDRG